MRAEEPSVFPPQPSNPGPLSDIALAKGSIVLGSMISDGFVLFGAMMVRMMEIADYN